MDFCPATQRWADSDPGGSVDVQLQRPPIAEQIPERPYVNRIHASATFRPMLQLMLPTRRLLLCTALSPGPRGGAHNRIADVDPVVSEAQPTANNRSVSETTNDLPQIRIS
jgi:hypothetical protein